MGRIVYRHKFDKHRWISQEYINDNIYLIQWILSKEDYLQNVIIKEIGKNFEQSTEEEFKYWKLHEIYPKY